MESTALQFVRAEDCVECFIYPISDQDWEGNPNLIDQTHQYICDFVNSLSKGYIWHKDCLKIFKRPNKSRILTEKYDSDLPSHMYGLCHFGDNVEDEWFVVYMMKEISRKFPSLGVQVVDADGEFLLVEAANALPVWADPNNCSNRVFFHRGQLHLLIPENKENIKELTITEALAQLKANNPLNVASNGIQESISLRIMDYPGKKDESFFRTTVYTPVGVAALLKEDPSLISAAVHAFCNRDPIDMKVCKAMRYFPPENRVNTSVTFTKCLYAMLVHSNFNPDRRTGWNLPLNNSPQYKSHSVGVKLACGFEILVSQARPGEGLETNKMWKEYMQSLSSRNYFQGLLPGSNGYNELLKKAKDFFFNNSDFNRVSCVSKRILELLGNVSVDEKEFRRNESMLPDDDDDKWLSIDPQELESLLQRRYGMKNFSALNSQTVPSVFSEKISEFLEHTSGVDGAEFPDNLPKAEMETTNLPSRPKRGIKTKKKQNKEVSFSSCTRSKSPSPARKNKIDFNADQFSSAIQNILDLVIPDDSWNLDSDTDLSEYGSGDELESNHFDLPPGDGKAVDSVMKKYMSAMDNELVETTMAKSFQTDKSECNTVDVDANVLTNMMESFQGEMGGVGPAGSMLGPLGFTKYENIIPIDDEVD